MESSDDVKTDDVTADSANRGPSPKERPGRHWAVGRGDGYGWVQPDVIRWGVASLLLLPTPLLDHRQPLAPYGMVWLVTSMATALQHPLGSTLAQTLLAPFLPIPPSAPAAALPREATPAATPPPQL